MRNIFAILFIIPLCISLNAQEKEYLNLYIGTFTAEGAEGIYHCRYHEATGKINFERVYKGIDNPSFLQKSPDGNFIYAVTRPSPAVESSGGYIQSYRIGPQGELYFINKQFSNGNDPCHVDISPDGKFAAVATYGSGTISLYRINDDGSIRAAASTIRNEGSGADKSRQSAPHAHSVLFSANGDKLFSADLGTDKINVFSLKENKLVPAGQPFLRTSPGAGPRHIRFHPQDKTLYVINELNSTVSVFTEAGGVWKEIQILSSLPENYEGTNYCADIHISPDGNYLYGSNRGHNSIAVFKISAGSNRLEWITAVPTQGDWPRNFTLSPDGKFLLSANQRSGDITIFRINPENGIPEFTGNKLEVPAPVCLLFQ